MPDDPAFIRTIAASPDDDAPRLVYADYLEETGDPAKMARAEFIRVQVEKARLLPDSPRWTELWHRDTALLDWARTWRAEFPRFRGIIEYGGFCRGFVDSVAVEAVAFANNFRQLVDCIPIRKLRLKALTLESVRTITQIAELDEVVDLELDDWINTPSILRAFARRGAWPLLKRFRCRDFPIGGNVRQLNRAWQKVWGELSAAFGVRLLR